MSEFRGVGRTSGSARCRPWSAREIVGRLSGHPRLMLQSASVPDLWVIWMICEILPARPSTLSEIFCTILVHRGVDLVTDEHTQDVVSEDLAQAQPQGQIGHRLAGARQRIEPLPIHDNVEFPCRRPPPSADLPRPATARPRACSGRIESQDSQGPVNGRVWRH
jgi:hypothetical protein